MPKLRKWLSLITIVLLTCPLSGCFDAVYTSATSVYNNYNVEKDWNNKLINLSVINALNEDKYITENGNIAVDTVNFVVLLTGYVDNIKVRDKAVSLAQKIRGVKRVVDAIVIGTESSVGQNVKDSWITAKIKSKFILNDKIDATAIKIITTRDGIVFLMGVVPERMAKLAARVAQTTDGVKKVICVFEIIVIKL